MDDLYPDDFDRQTDNEIQVLLNDFTSFVTGTLRHETENPYMEVAGRQRITFGPTHLSVPLTRVNGLQCGVATALIQDWLDARDEREHIARRDMVEIYAESNEAEGKISFTVEISIKVAYLYEDEQKHRPLPPIRHRPHTRQSPSYLQQTGLYTMGALGSLLIVLYKVSTGNAPELITAMMGLR